VISAPNQSQWLQKYQWLIAVVTVLHMGGSVVNSAARIHRGVDTPLPPELSMYVTGAFIEASIQGAGGFCLWLLVSGLRSSTSRAVRILLGLALTVYPCLCLMIPFNLVAGLVAVSAEIWDWRTKRGQRGVP
jgi:hypothetical protein